VASAQRRALDREVMLAPRTADILACTGSLSG
jgi:hypothetical protein